MQVLAAESDILFITACKAFPQTTEYQITMVQALDMFFQPHPQFVFGLAFW